MQNRFVVVTVAACIAGTAVAGCSSKPKDSPQPPGSLPPVTAQVTLNGKPAGTTHQLHCTQDGWTHTIKTGDEKSGITLVVDTNTTVTARSVVFNNVGDFNGSVWPNKIGNANAALLGSTFKVNGTAEGATTENPNQKTTASFEIKANC